MKEHFWKFKKCWRCLKKALEVEEEAVKQK